jgi:hypothetical protein
LSRRPPSSRSELRLPPCLPFVYPLRTAPSHPRCHAIRLARNTSDLRASHMLSSCRLALFVRRLAHVVYVVVVHLHVRARASGLHVICVLFRACCSRTQNRRPVRIGIALAAQPPAPSWSRPPASVVLPSVRALPRCRRAPPGGRAASMLRLVRRGQPAASRRSQPAPRPGLARLRSPGAARAACVVRLGPCATPAQ